MVKINHVGRINDISTKSIYRKSQFKCKLVLKANLKKFKGKPLKYKKLKNGPSDRL